MDDTELLAHICRTFDEYSAAEEILKAGFRRHENGQYMNTCHLCHATFMGHKRRVTCRVCAAPPET